MFVGDIEVWQHLHRTVLTDYVVNSLLLMVGVAVCTLLLGVPAAWFTSVCDFPGKSIFVWALLLPLAFPAYIIAYTYTGLLDFSGPVQTFIRDITGWGYGDYWFIPVRSIPGAIVMLSLVLYPYVYLLARAAFLEQSLSTLEVGRTLGYSITESFLKLAIPLARPAIVAGLTLALMETLADFGTVQYFGISTFTTGIFRAFYGFGDSSAAAQLSGSLLTFVVVLVLLERYSRREARYHTAGGKSSRQRQIRFKGRQVLWAWIGCLIPVCFGFVIPALVLLKWAVTEATWDGGSFLLLIWHSFSLALIAAVIAVVAALLLGYARRLHRSTLVKTSVSLSGLGYAVPGTIIAIGVIIPLAWLDHQVMDLSEKWFGLEIGLLFSGTIIALLFAYTVRFLAVSLGSIQSGLENIRPSFDYAARSLGQPPSGVLKNVHIPMMRSSVLTALLIVFVDVLKELPATLMLRPFNYNTLAVRAYELASDERLVDAAPASLMIILVGILPVILLSRSISTGYTGK